MKDMKKNFPWDKYSDQPYPLKDKQFKKRMKRRHVKELLPLFVYNLIIFPLAVCYAFLVRKPNKSSQHFFGLCVNLDKSDEQISLVEELSCRNLQIRVPLSDIDNLDDYLQFAQRFETDKLLITILQDRPHIEDHELLIGSVRKVFSAFSTLATEFQIGNAINRSKWGFFSTAEYLAFYQKVQQLRDTEFTGLKLVGPSVIDYEYHFTIRALFNRYKVRYDKLSALLYVDRRGAPENKQMIFFDTLKKIDFLYAIARLSPKTQPDILITEANWPISNTAPWAPTSETECVSEQDYANYLLRYYLLALASGKVETVYWHQLIAPGYGLVDSREGIRKRSAFYTFKYMLKMLQGAQQVRLSKRGDLYTLACVNDGRELSVKWLNSERQENYSCAKRAFNQLGEQMPEGDVILSASPVYFLD